MDAARQGRRATVCIVGAGPRGTSILERLCANASTMFEVAGMDIDIHLIDPWPPGPGRVWRANQPGLLWLNSTSGDNTLYPDETVACDGPTGTGPDFVTWARQIGPERLAGRPLAAEAERIHPGWFPSRHLYGEYLSWVVERTVAAARPGVRVELHADQAVELTDDESGRQVVHLASGAAITADAVVLALGHQDVAPTAEESALVAFADRHGLTYVPTAYSADPSLDGLAPGADVIVRGMGLAFIDCMVLLNEGRGGHFERGFDGQLRYLPSGAEPHLHVGSRRGVPYHAKTSYGLGAGRPPLPHFFTPAACEDLFRSRGPLDLRQDLWPLMAKELAFGHYHELFLAHPERTVGSWEDFGAVLAVSAGDGHADPEIARRVPDTADRLDLAHLDRPLHDLVRGARGEVEAVQTLVEDWIVADLARRSDPASSADLGLITALLSCFATIGLASNNGWLSMPSRILDLDGWFHGFFSYVASGPPPIRTEQLIALARAGLVHFLGPDLKLTADPVVGRFRAEGALGPAIEADALLEARLPEASVARSLDPLIQRLHATGACAEDVAGSDEDGFPHPAARLRVDAHHRLIDAAGRAHDRRFALGPWTDRTRLGSGVPRPRLNAPFFRHNDALARDVLALLVRDRALPDEHHDQGAGLPCPR